MTDNGEFEFKFRSDFRCSDPFCSDPSCSNYTPIGSLMSQLGYYLDQLSNYLDQLDFLNLMDCFLDFLDSYLLEGLGDTLVPTVDDSASQLQQNAKDRYFNDYTELEMLRLCEKCIKDLKKQTRLIKKMEQKPLYFITPIKGSQPAEVKYLPNMRDVKGLNLRKFAVRTRRLKCGRCNECLSITWPKVLHSSQ